MSALCLAIVISCLALSLDTSGCEAKLLITEIMFASSHSPGDSEYLYWWELINKDGAIVPLGGYSWDDNSAGPGEFVFPDVSIKPGESIIIPERDDVLDGAAIQKFMD